MTSSSSNKRPWWLTAATATTLTLLTAGPVAADIYDELAALTDSITAWSQEPPAAWVAATDTLDLAALFPGARTSLDANRDVIVIEQPVYLRTMRSSVEIDSASWRAGDLQRGWRLPEVAADSLSLATDAHRLLVWLRTCGLPANLAAPRPEGDAPVELVLRGRQTVRWELGRPSALAIVARLARGRQVYAGFDAGAGGDQAVYMLVTSPEASGHHFLIWELQTAARGERIELVAFVPTGNLADLFATAARPPAGPRLEVPR